MRNLPIVAALVHYTNVAVADTAGEIIEASKLNGGLAVVVGCDASTLYGNLSMNGFVVQMRGTAAKEVANARDRLLANGLQGKVSAVTFDGTLLPYVAQWVCHDGSARFHRTMPLNASRQTSVHFSGRAGLRRDPSSMT